MKLNLKLFFLLTTIFISSCSDEKLSPEDEIKKYIESAKLAAENRSFSDLAELIDDNYRDQNKLDKKQLAKKAQAYFYLNQNIHLLTKINNITLQDDNNAFVVLHIAMAANIIADSNALTSLRAQVYKFELLLIKKDSWFLQQAKWQVATVKDML
ncbi:MAG: hypothetical protein DIZ80_01740 [endosymbiont of Galathealinum brachiosum]|uniref:DUF4440 domain-containing protein n=1 Tax=endosymbiont of Galathealinum brachiosum TaxID=2200906 RepID=A0A370DMR8_9GAMM|nr:MAG: hypothetical protein DIZ80_01740 [endosymbiont of Galathealinum brachiosum]